MLRYIPDFILQKSASQQATGSFQGYALLFDVADFTPISSEFQRHGKEGAEELSKFLDFVFGEPIRIVESCGGFVSLFAGDAFCAIFPLTKHTEIGSLEGKNAFSPVLAATHSIQVFFHDKCIYQSPLGRFHLQVRQTVSFGEIHWQIYESDLQNEYVFSGKPMQDLAELSALKSELVFSGAAAARIGLDGFEPGEYGGYVVSTEDRNPHATVAELSKAPFFGGGSASAPTCMNQQSPATSARFLNPKYQANRPQNEIRSAAFCFANLDALAPEMRESAIARLQHLADKYSGFVNKYDATDKGLTAFILFGIPLSEGKTLERICLFALEAVEAVPELGLGISCGSVFAGWTGSGAIREYTAFGNPVNLANRLMSKARAGEVLTDSYLWQELHAAYDFSYLGSLNLKGIEPPIRYYRLKRLAQQGQREEHGFVGRDEELGQLRELVDQAISSRENTIVYVNGDAGIGKSRLVSEALAPYSLASLEPGKSCQKYFITCDAILRKPLEAIRQILRSHFYYNSALPIEAAIPMFRVLWSQIDPADREMQRIESFLAALIGLEWEGSIWNLLPPEEKPHQLRQAFVHLIRKLAQSRPILIHLDDGQWLDEESLSYFQALTDAEICPVIIVSPCRYQEDGSKAELQLSKHRRADLELDSLSDSGSSALISSIMRLNHLLQDTRDLIIGRSMGNPLFIEQLTSYLMETGSLSDKGEIVKELGYLSSFSISDIISSRIDRLTDNVKECLISASVLGMEFNIKVLSEMLKSDLTQELEAGTNSRIWKDLDELRYIFSHILIKDIVYQRMMSDKLKELHKLAAEAMEIVFPDKLDENAEEIAMHYEKAGMQEKAAEYYHKAGSWFRKRYDWEKSEYYLKIALEIRENVLGAEHSDTADSMNNLADLYYYQGKYVQAEALHLRALEIREKTLGAKHPDTAYSLNNLASLYYGQGKYEQAEPLYLRALEIKEKVFGAEHPYTASSLNNLALLYSDQCKYDQAEHLLVQALDIQEKVQGREHLDTASSLNNLASLYLSQEKHNHAEPLLLRALEIKKRILGAEHPVTASSLNNLALLYDIQGKYEQAEPLYLGALEIREKVMGAEHPDTAYSLNGMAGLYKSQGRYEQAEALFLRALEIREKVFGAHPDTAYSLNNLASLYDDQGKYEQAEPLYLRAIEIYQKVLGAGHPYTALPIANLGLLFKATGKLNKAEEMLLKALDIWLPRLGVTDNWTQEAIKGITDLYDKMNQPGKAAQYQAMLPPEEKTPE